MFPSDDSPPSDGSVPPSQAIVEAVAEREGVEVTDIEPPAYEPLFAVVNPEALDRLFRTGGAAPETASVTLEYVGYHVTVHGDGRVEVSDSPGTDDSVNASIEE